MFVLTLDQRGSSGSPDLVASEERALNAEFWAGLQLPFVRTAGDEMQALVRSARVLVDVVLRATRAQNWWVGVGLGPIDEIGETARDSRGPAFVSARSAVGRAKRTAWGCAVDGDPEHVATGLEDCFAMLVFVRATRSDRSWELVDMASGGMRGVDIARDLKITKQAVSKQLRAAGFFEEQRGRNLAVSLLDQPWKHQS